LYCVGDFIGKFFYTRDLVFEVLDYRDRDYEDCCVSECEALWLLVKKNAAKFWRRMLGKFLPDRRMNIRRREVLEVRAMTGLSPRRSVSIAGHSHGIRKGWSCGGT